MRKLFIAAALSVVIVALSAVNADDPPQPEEPETYAASLDNSGMISAPVTYKETMLIAVTKEGVAAIVFGEQVDKGIRYRFRFLPADGTKEITGEDAVWETYLDGKYEGAKETVKAGRISFGWSRSGDDRGWFYYKPEKMRLQIASANRFEDYTRNLDGKKVEKLDLKRFLKQP